MPIKTITARAAVPRTLFDGFDERPVDMDFVLPDYYPDVAAVLKCQLRPLVQSRRISGDRVVVEGTAAIRVMYLDEGRQCVRSCEFSQPFSSSFSVPELTPAAAIQTAVKTDYINCRATSPRRLDVHGAFSVKLKAVAAGETELLRDVEGESFQKRFCTVTGSVPAATAEKSFTLSETLELESGKPDAQSLIRGEAVPVLSECKIMMNKVILKGCLYLHHLYAGQAGQMETVDHEIPFSQIVDVDGLQDDWQCDVDLEVSSGDVHITADPNGAGTRLSAAVKMTTVIRCVRQEEITALSDVYSTRFATQTQPQTLETEQLVGIVRQSETVRQTIDLPPDDIVGIVDLWGEASVVSQRCENGAVSADGRLLIYLLTRDSAGTIGYYERPLDLPLTWKDPCDRAEVALSVVGVKYTVNPQKQVEMEIALTVTRRSFLQHHLAVVGGVTGDTEDVFPAEKAALKIYYAAAGESLWEIAKAGHTSMEEVMAENDLTADILPADTMLLVPLC